MGKASKGNFYSPDVFMIFNDLVIAHASQSGMLSIKRIPE